MSHPNIKQVWLLDCGRGVPTEVSNEVHELWGTHCKGNGDVIRTTLKWLEEDDESTEAICKFIRENEPNITDDTTIFIYDSW